VPLRACLNPLELVARGTSAQEEPVWLTLKTASALWVLSALLENQLVQHAAGLQSTKMRKAKEYVKLVLKGTSALILPSQSASQ